jgi:hypothetical protein
MHISKDFLCGLSFSPVVSQHLAGAAKCTF